LSASDTRGVCVIDGRTRIALALNPRLRLLAKIIHNPVPKSHCVEVLLPLSAKFCFLGSDGSSGVISNKLHPFGKRSVTLTYVAAGALDESSEQTGKVSGHNPRMSRIHPDEWNANYRHRCSRRVETHTLRPRRSSQTRECRVRIIDLIFAIENQLLCFPENDVFVTE